MSRAATRVAAVVSALAALAVASAPAQAAPAPIGYQQNDVGGFRNILPPGQGQNVNAAEVAAFLGGGHAAAVHRRPATTCTRTSSTRRPGCRTPRSTTSSRTRASASAPGTSTETYTPLCILPTAPQSDACENVTIVRDEFGVPHIYGETRLGAMFGAGYASAEDRLFFMDVLRHAGRGKLSSFVGGGNVGMDRDVWADTPYNEDELQLQFDLGDEVYGADGAQLQADVEDYVDGINQYIAEIKSVSAVEDAGRVRGARPAPGPRPVEGHRRDLDRLAGRRDLRQGRRRRGRLGARARGGEAAVRAQAGQAGLGGLPPADDPEAARPSTRSRFPYGTGPRKARKAAGSRCPTPARPRREPLDRRRRAATAPAGPGPVGDLLEPFEAHGLRPRTRCSSRRASRRRATRSRSSGRRSPTSRPQILMEQDIHAPGDQRGPGDRRPRRRLPRHQPLRPARPRRRLLVERDLGRPGHHRHLRGAALRARRRRGRRCGSQSYVYRGAVPRRSRCSSARTAGRRRSPTTPRPGCETLRVAAHAARDRHPPRRDRRRALRLHQAARHLLPRGRLGARVLRLQQPGQGRPPRELHARRRAGSTTPSTGSTSTTSTSPTSTRATTRCARRRSTRTSRRSGSRTSGRTSDPELQRDRPSCRCDAAPAGHRPAVPDELEQQAGARLPRRRRQLRLRLDLPLRAARRADPGRDRGRRRDEPGRAGQRDGGRRHRRPARRLGAAAGAQGDPQGRARRDAQLRRRDRRR